MKKVLLGLIFVFSTASFASDYMVINVASINDTGIKNLIGLDGKYKGTIDCSKLRSNGAKVDLRQFTNMVNGSVSIKLKTDEGKVLSYAENYYFQDSESCKKAVRLIEDTASFENPVSLILDYRMLNKVFISVQH